MDTDAIAEGTAAWQRLKQSQRSTFDDWLTVGHALAIGRTDAMHIAKVNVPFGKKYNALIGLFLRSNGFDDITKAARGHLARIIKNLPDVLRWREALPEARRVTLNHPESCWLHFASDTQKRGYRIPPSRRQIHKPGNRPIPPRPSGDRIKCVADAMRETRSTDWFVLATAACKADDAFAKEQKIAELRAEPPAKIGRPKPAAAEHVAA